MDFPAYARFLELTGSAAAAITPETQNSDYESGRVRVGPAYWRIRTARLTPRKPGAFVAVWRRAATGQTEPFDSADECAGLMVFVAEQSRFGVFAFSNAHLIELGITRSPGLAALGNSPTSSRSSASSSVGKRGFRVYPSWCTQLNATAARTQLAQASAFTDLSPEGAAARIHLDRAERHAKRA